MQTGLKITLKLRGRFHGEFHYPLFIKIVFEKICLKYDKITQFELFYDKKLVLFETKADFHIFEIQNDQK